MGTPQLATPGLVSEELRIAESLVLVKPRSFPFRRTPSPFDVLGDVAGHSAGQACYVKILKP